METDKMVQILRRVRHDFANHIQVISGYEQMGMHERVKAYIDSIMDQMILERVLFESLDAEAALYLYSQLLNAYDLGIILRYEDLEFTSLSTLQENNEPLTSLGVLRNEIQSSADDEAIVYVSFYEDSGGIDMLLSCELLPQETRTVRVNRE